MEKVHNHVRGSTSLRKIENHKTAAPSQALIPFIGGAKRSMSNSGVHVRTEGVAALNHSFYVRTMNILLELIIGESIILHVNERFPVMNNSRVSLRMLFSCRNSCANLYFEMLQVQTNIKGRKTQIL